MNLDRSLLKTRSKEVIRNSNPKVLTASLLVTVLGILVSYLSGRLVGISGDDALRYLQYLQDGNAEAALTIVLSNTPSTGAQLVNMLLDAVIIIVGLGFLIFLLNSLRGTSPDLGNLLDGFNYWWKVLVLDLVCGLFILLWSLLLVIPGLVAAYRYSMANYLLITHPEYGVMDCIRESKRLTQGWKAQLFVLDLSFLGWWLLCLVPVLGWLLSIWVTPYRSLSFLQVYEQLSGASVSGSERETWEL